MKTPTNREIALVCGVSPSTVSRALNHHYSIPESTRRRIVRVARKLGWQPNPLASAYMAHLRSTNPPSFKAILGVIVDYPMPNGVESLISHIRYSYEGFNQRARKYGYHTQVFSLQDPDFASTGILDTTLFNRNIPGFVITGLSKPRRVLSGLNWSRYAIVAMAYSMPHPQVHRVAMNVTHGFLLILKKAFALGYNHIAVVTPVEYDKRTNHGLLMPATYFQQNLKRGQSLEIFKYSQLDRKGIETVAKWLDRTRPEFAVGPGIYEAIQLLGWRIPQDIAMATFDRSPGFPEHAGLDQRYKAAGALAADVLINEITQNRRGIPSDPVEHTIRGRWVDGPTAPPRHDR